MRLLVCGDRNWTNYGAIYREIQARNPEVVIEGEARGADTMARIAAVVLGIPVLPFPAEWELHGKAAGPIRNQKMLDEGKPTEVIAFHTNIDASKGTKNMVSLAAKNNVPVYIYES